MLTWVEVIKVYVESALQTFYPRIKGSKGRANFTQNIVSKYLERHEKGEALVIPVIVRDVNWRIAPFAKLQALPENGRAVARWRDRDAAWRNVSERIEQVVEGIRKKQRSRS